MTAHLFTGGVGDGRTPSLRSSVPGDTTAGSAADPFRIEGPCLWSFSGGRTSGYMLWRALQTYGGTLPDDHVVGFSNTGKEREETLRFVYECGSRWGVHVRWVEWRPKGSDPWPFKPEQSDTPLAIWWKQAVERCGEAGHEIVSFNSASRNGEPFAALIAHRGYVPNSVSRFCSVTLKVRAMRELVRAELGWKAWKNAIGLRHDEGYRIMKALARNASNKEPFKAAVPLGNARVTRPDVLRFWLGDSMIMGREQPQGFDLGLHDYEGNCDLCFLKRRGKLLQIEQDSPGRAEWWAAQERSVVGTARIGTEGHRFRPGDGFDAIARDAAAQPNLFDHEPDDEADAECGLWCADEAA